ncbi:MAG: 16S rRNA processing protein RimM [Arcobacteraceae bacterium]|jgi:16S rRNA processing protein RimM
MDKIFIAKLGKTVGLKGQQKLHIDTDFPEQFKKDTKLTTDKNQELIIESFNNANNVVKFVGIDTIEAATKLTNRQLYVSTEDTRDMCKLAEKQFFWFDMIGCTIKENDQILGTINDIQRMPLSDYLIIDTSEELIKEDFSKTFLLPYTDNYISSVDIENKIILTNGAKAILEAS